MGGLKEKQALQAMVSILGQLQPNDFFDVLLFDDRLVEWKGQMTIASSSNVQAAQAWCRANLQATGSTGIYDALRTSVARLSDVSNDYVKMSIFLSDGEASHGPTNPLDSWQVARFKQNQACLHSLGFGFSLNFELLQQLSWDNCGVPRRIYEESDAADQLENFFIEFSQPLLRDLRWEWPDGIEERSLASPQSNTEVYFGGGEICTVGAFKPNENKNLTSERASQLVSGLKVSASARSQLAGSTDGGESQLKMLSLAPSAASMSLGKSNSSRRLFQQTK